MKNYDWNEFGEGDQKPQPPQFDAVALVSSIMVAVGLALLTIII